MHFLFTVLYCLFGFYIFLELILVGMCQIVNLCISCLLYYFNILHLAFNELSNSCTLLLRGGKEEIGFWTYVGSEVGLYVTRALQRPVRARVLDFPQSISR